ncbi:hypothetical protein SAMN05660337_1330 [Maridesulfovibrio ferrireducens]|uniref:Uncharacterized protein n=1 Tax=Maridesulfovibrio ferrireducens TaxID=246191 RepID=A0A1G9EZW4_9BACT|nr:hypothetical protein [Maridesulfovibrio ferrireducens]SDK81670.1 hypothetical protein SAMN05660337_1330 [Maridesulfovibrio ferrireducens]
MLVRNKKAFYQGLTLAIGFLGVLYYMFTPSFNGMNAFHASDDLFNSISKGSTYYIPQVMEGIKKFDGQSFETTIFKDQPKYIPYATTLLEKNGFDVAKAEQGIAVSGDIGKLMTSVTEDSDVMFHNKGQVLVEKYGMDARQALYVWWQTMKEVKASLDQQKAFPPATFIGKNVINRAIEVGYNYYGIEGQQASERWGVIAFSLIFYVVYTMWWGYAIFFMFEGIGLEMTSSRKKEA